MKIDVQLPPSGPGFVTNNRGAHGEFQFGQRSSIDAALTVATAWNDLHAGRPFSIGQISKAGGGPFPPHKSHRLGIDIDVRPMRLDGKNEPVNISDPQYDRALTTEVIDLWWTKAPVQQVFFNDPTVIARRLSQYVDGHHNHFHVRLRMHGATIKIRDRGSDVAFLQTKLGINADGRFGVDTETAVEAFQVAHHLTPDGVVGAKTWAALDTIPGAPENFVGAGVPLDAAGIYEAMDRMGIGAAELWSVMVVETLGCGFLADRRPVILFERHIFSRETQQSFDSSHPDLSNPQPGGYGAGGEHQYERLHRAIKLNRTAALKSASWGIGQVMGFNHEKAGYENVERMVKAMMESESEQLRALTSTIIAGDLHQPLSEHRWADFARGYNGKNYAINKYDTRLAAAFLRFSQGALPDVAVRTAQVLLTYLGFHPGTIDGMPGKFTLAALHEFQVQQNLPPDNEINDQIIALLRSKALPG